MFRFCSSCTEGFLSYLKKYILKYNEGYFGSWSYFYFYLFYSIISFLVKSTEVFTLQFTDQFYILRTRCWSFPSSFLLDLHIYYFDKLYC